MPEVLPVKHGISHAIFCVHEDHSRIYQQVATELLGEAECRVYPSPIVADEHLLFTSFGQSVAETRDSCFSFGRSTTAL